MPRQRNVMPADRFLSAVALVIAAIAASQNDGPGFRTCFGILEISLSA